MENYKPNSHKAKAEANRKKNKEIKKVATAKVKKKSKLKGSIIQEDVDNIKSYVVMDVLIPALKKAITDVVTNGVSMLLYGDTKRTSGKKKSYVSYDRMSDRDTSYRRVGYYIDDIILETRTEAEDVIDQIGNIIDDYDECSIADLYDMVGITGDHTDNKYGWTSTARMDVARDRNGGWVLKLPKAKPLD